MSNLTEGRCTQSGCEIVKQLAIIIIMAVILQGLATSNEGDSYGQ